MELALLGCAAVSLLTTIGIVWVLARGTVGLFLAVSLGEFVGPEHGPEHGPAWLTDPRFGVGPLLAGTLVTSAIAIVVAVPIGLLAAIYLAVYTLAGDSMRGAPDRRSGGSRRRHRGRRARDRA